MHSKQMIETLTFSSQPLEPSELSRASLSYIHSLIIHANRSLHEIAERLKCGYHTLKRHLLTNYGTNYSALRKIDIPMAGKRFKDYNEPKLIFETKPLEHMDLAEFHETIRSTKSLNHAAQLLCRDSETLIRYFQMIGSDFHTFRDMNTLDLFSMMTKRKRSEDDEKSSILPPRKKAKLISSKPLHEKSHEENKAYQTITTSDFPTTSSRDGRQTPTTDIDQLATDDDHPASFLDDSSVMAWTPITLPLTSDEPSSSSDLPLDRMEVDTEQGFHFSENGGITFFPASSQKHKSQHFHHDRLSGLDEAEADTEELLKEWQIYDLNS